MAIDALVRSRCMVGQHALIERAIPDLTATAHLPTLVAAEIDFLAGRLEPWTESGPPMVRARAWVGLDEVSRAAALVRDVDLTTLSGTDLTAAAWTISRIGPSDAARSVLASLREQPDFLLADDVPLGPRGLAEGPLLAAVGEMAGADRCLLDAVDAGDVRAPLWGALARVELARVRLSVLAAGAEDPVPVEQGIDRLLTSARLFFRAGGYRSVLARVADLTAATPTLGAPNAGRLVPGVPWQVGFGVACDVPVRASKGLVALRHLVQNPGRAIPAIELDRVVNGGEPIPVEAMLTRLDVNADDDIDSEIRDLLFDDTVRSRVGKLLARAIQRLEDQHPLLGAHLKLSTRTGYTCRYDPPPGSAVVWAT